MLDDAQKAFWRHQGYLVLPGFKTAAELKLARDRAHSLVHSFEPSAQSSRFSTRDRSLVGDAALLASAEQVHCFFEEEAIAEDGQLRVPKAQSVNKIGHALHDLDPVFDAFSHGPVLAELGLDLGLQQPQVWQSQLIFKQPRIGGEVGWHQDASFFVTDPISVLTFWFALEDASLDNGCLWVQAGGHRAPHGVLREQYVAESGRLQMRQISALAWPTLEEAVALPVEAGTLVCFHGLLPHCSAANRSPKSRMAYTLHVTEGHARYSAQNWLQRSDKLPLRGLA